MLSITKALRGLFARPATPSRPRRTQRPVRLECLEERTLLCNPGELDLTFDGDGKVTTDFGGVGGPGQSDRWGEWAADLVVQPDGKILAGGTVVKKIDSKGFAVDEDFALARYNADGSLDASFGTNGKVTTDFSRRNDRIRAIALQPDGKIVAVGLAHIRIGGVHYSHFGVVRYNANGTLDTSFDKDGKVTTQIGGKNSPWDVAIQGDGKIVVVGRATPPNHFGENFGGQFAVVRYTTAGKLDTSFSGDGIVMTDIVHPEDGPNFNPADDAAHSVAIQSDGRIVVLGEATGSLALARYDTNGSLDMSFGSGGTIVVDADTGPVFVGLGEARAMALQSDGKIVAAGSFISRYNADGSLDTSFDLDGIATMPGERARGIAIQFDGKIVAAGAVTLVRYDTNGSLDASFDGDGIVTMDFNSDSLSEGIGIAIQADGAIVAAGRYSTDFGVARYCA